MLLSIINHFPFEIVKVIKKRMDQDKRAQNCETLSFYFF